jgi:WD40 repeat protein
MGKGKYLLASGAFDHRIRILSAKTLKIIVMSNFHSGIINNIEMEKKSDNEIIVYSCAEDGYLAIWNL